jgi:hypothetical protein
MFGKKEDALEQTQEIAKEPEPEIKDLAHRLPIRPNYDVELRVPRDLTMEEVRRITKWLESIALPKVGEPPALPPKTWSPPAGT